MIRHTLLVAAAAALALGSFASAAQAGDLGGAYLGVNFGHDWTKLETQTSGLTFQPGSADDTGIEFGIAAGYNVVQGGLLLGVELDLNNANHVATYAVGTQAVTTELLYLASARARVGYDVGGFVPYITGGVAGGESVLKINDAVSNLSSRNLQLGYTIGAGVEFAVTDQISVKSEYSYSNIGTGDAISINSGGLSNTVGNHTEVHGIRVGANFRF